jgi:hypothetical protein
VNPFRAYWRWLHRVGELIVVGLATIGEKAFEHVVVEDEYPWPLCDLCKEEDAFIHYDELLVCTVCKEQLVAS